MSLHRRSLFSISTSAHSPTCCVLRPWPKRPLGRGCVSFCDPSEGGGDRLSRVTGPYDINSFAVTAPGRLGGSRPSPMLTCECRSRSWCWSSAAGGPCVTRRRCAKLLLICPAVPCRRWSGTARDRHSRCAQWRQGPDRWLTLRVSIGTKIRWSILTPTRKLRT